MKRILLVLTVAVVMASMLVMGTSAAFAKDKIDKPDKKIDKPDKKIEKEDKGKDKGKDK